MAEDIDINITANDKASPVVDKLAKKMEALQDPEIELELSNTDRAIAAIEKVAAEAKKAEAAAQALGQALGPELSAKADLTGMVSDLQRMGLSLEEITADADRLGATIKEVGSTDATGGLTTGMRNLDGEMKSVGGSASVMANAIGNTTQDLAQLGGVAGTAGVALGQMGEYMADARLQGEGWGSIVQNFGAIVGPLAAVSVAMAGISDLMSKMASGQAATKAFDAEQVEQFSDAIREGTDVTEEYAETLAKTGEVLVSTGSKGGPAWLQILPGGSMLNNALTGMGKFGDQIENLLPLLNKAGVSADIWTETITSDRPVAAMDKLRSALAQTNISTDDQHKILIAAKEAQGNYADSVSNSAEVNKFFGAAVEDNTEAIEDQIDATQKAVEEAVKHAEALVAQGEALRDAALAWDAAAAMGESYAAALGEINAASDIDFAKQAFQTVASFDTLKDALRDLKAGADDWRTVDLVPDSVEEFRGVSEEVQAVTDALGGMRDAIQTELQGVMATEGIDAWAEKFQFFSEQVRSQFMAMFLDMGLSQEEAVARTNEVLGELNLDKETKQITIELTNEQQAREALETFADYIQTLDVDKQIDINTAIAEGDIPAALALLNDELIAAHHEPITLGTEVNTFSAQADLDQFVSSNSGRTITLKANVTTNAAKLGALVGATAVGTAAPTDEELAVGAQAAPPIVVDGFGTPRAVIAGQPIQVTNVHVNIPTADPSAHVRALQRWTRTNGNLPIMRGRG